MLTNNYKNWVLGVLKGADSSGRNNFENIMDINGNIVSFTTYNSAELITLGSAFSNYTFEDITQKSSGESIFVGVGQREESQGDIALESLIPDSDLTMNSANVTFTEGKFVFTKTFTYVGTNDITVNETAFYKKIYSYDNREGYIVCLARQVIEPLTVSNGDVFTVTMVIG